MLAATAVTSAAIIVPVAVQAAAEANLLGTATNVNIDEILTVTNPTDANGDAITVANVEWHVVSDVTTLPTTSGTQATTFTVPLSASNQFIKVIVTANDGQTYEDTIYVNPVQTADLFNGQTAANFNDIIAVTAPKINEQTITMSGVKWYIDGQLVSDAVSYQVAYKDLGKTLKAVAKGSDGNVYEDTILLNTMNTLSIPFNEVDEENNTLTNAVTTATINTQLSANLPTSVTGTIVKYEWFIKDVNGNTALIEGENDMLMTVPLQAEGKELLLVLTMADGTKSETILNVAPFNFPTTLTVPVTLNGKELSATPSLAPKDVLAVGDIDLASLDLLPSQVNISYEWYFTTQDSPTSSLIPNAVSSSFTIPSDAFVRSLDNFKVVVKIEVPALNKTSVPYSSALIVLNIKPAQDLVTAIDTLVQGGIYEKANYSELEDLERALKDMQSNYDALSTNSKLLVTNYSVLQAALANIALVKPLVTELQAFQTKKAAYDADKKAGEHAKLVKEFTAIEKKYNSLTRLQRSLLELTDFSDSYVETMVNLLKNSNEVGLDNSSSSDKTQTTYAAVDELNQEILALVSLNALPNTYNVADTRAEFVKEVESLLERTKKIDRTFQPILYTSILKTALSDVKKAEAAVEKINKITITTGTKKASAAKAAQNAVAKLTALQYSLLTDDELAILAETVQTESDKVAELIEAIDEVLENSVYKLDGYSYTHTADKNLEAVPAILAEQFKALSSDSRKLVTNYTKINVFKKDIKAAQKVMTAINNAIIAEEAIDDTTDKTLSKTQRAAFTKYRSAYKAYVKLTPQQRSIVDQHPIMEDISFSFGSFTDSYKALSDELNIPIEDDVATTDPDDEPAAPIYEDGNVRNVVNLLVTLEESVTTSVTSLEDVQAQIANIKVEYKNLKPAEKKNVYNYSSLSTANSIANKAKSAKKKLDTAIASNDSKKLNNALAAYAKLTTPQQLLIQDEYETAIETLEELRGETPDFEDLAVNLETLADEPNLDSFKSFEESIEGLTSKELKLIPNYKLYQELVKDKKVVEKYFAKLVKLGEEPTYSQKEAMIQAFNKLTTRQQAFALNFYPESNPDLKLEEEFAEWESRANTATELNDEIGSILVAGQYTFADSEEQVNDLASLATYIEHLEAEMKKLDSKERKLITHKNFIKTIEKDAKAVSEVVELAELFEAAAESEKQGIYEQWKREYERLSISQQSLYGVVSVELDEPTTP